MYTIDVKLDDYKHTKGDWERTDNNISANQKTICCCQMQNFKHDKYGRQIPDIEAQANAQLVLNAPKMLRAIIIQQQRLEMLINLTPTGGLRNQLCDENMALMQLLADIKG